MPAPADPLPQVTSRGDTLYVLAQRVGATTDVTTRLHRYRVTATDCA
ncbi:MAG: hypothetical protein MUF00_15440 [Gemmatimonadaceae bacterium]|nr:hypothetical protein [Gemmatimonadaceae bacterium]